MVVKSIYSKQKRLHLNDKEAHPKGLRLNTHVGEGSDVFNIPLSCEKDIIAQNDSLVKGMPKKGNF